MIQKAAHIFWRPCGAGRADSFMGFLGIGGFGFIKARFFRYKFIAIGCADSLAQLSHGFHAHLHAIGSHIGNQASGFSTDIHPFIQLLGNLHCTTGRKAQLARGFLLQGRGRKGRGRAAAHAFCFNIGYCPVRFANTVSGPGRYRFARKAHLVQLFTIQIGDAGGKALCLAILKQGIDRPIFLCAKGFYFCLSLAYQAKCNRLYASCRARAWQFAP